MFPAPNRSPTAVPTDIASSSSTYALSTGSSDSTAAAVATAAKAKARARATAKEARLVQYSLALKEAWGSPIKHTSALGHGGQGTVFKVATGNGEVYAAKLFLKEANLKKEVDFFERIAAHQPAPPGFPIYYGVKTIFQKAALVTDCVDGAGCNEVVKQLNAHMKQLPRDTKVAVESVLVLGQALFSCLAYLERLGLSHCDIKPSNLMLSREGELKLIDFGLWRDAAAKPTRRGTFGFMAPELTSGEASAEALDLSKVDVYAAGNVLMGLLTGFQIGQDFESLDPVGKRHNRSQLKKTALRAHTLRGLTATNFSQSARPEEALCVVRSAFEPHPPGAKVDLKVLLSQSLNRYGPPKADPLAADMQTLLSACMRADWEKRPSAAEMSEAFEGLASMHLPPSGDAQAREFLKTLVQKTMSDKAAKTNQQGACADV